MELTLTGASLNSDSNINNGGTRQRSHKSTLPSSAASSVLTGAVNGSDPSLQSATSSSTSMSLSSSNQATIITDNDTARASIAAVGPQQSQLNNDKSKDCKKPCCEDSHNQHRSQNYVDITSVPKDKLTNNPPMLMNALVTSIRGKGTFDTFTYLIQVVLEFESKQNGPMKWGRSSHPEISNANMESNSLHLNDKHKLNPNYAQNNTHLHDMNDNLGYASCLTHYSDEGHTFAHWCAKRNDDVRFLEYLVQFVPQVNLNLPSLDDVGMKPIHWACTEGSIPNVSFLLNHYRTNNNNNNSNSSMDQATPPHENHDDIINTLESSHCTPLLVASQYGHADLVAFLIKRGANPYAVDNSGDTAFHWAAYKGAVPVCSLLLHLHCHHLSTANTGTITDEGGDEGGDLYGYLDLQDNFGQCPLHLASLRGNTNVVEYILEEAERFVDRALANRNNQNRNPTAENSSLLQDIESNIDRKSKDIEQYPNMLLNLKDKNGKTPVELAIKKKHTVTEMLLQAYSDKHKMYNQSLIGKFKVLSSQLFSFRNWLLWMGFVSDGAGRPPKFIFWFVIINLFIACCLEAFIYAPLVWIKILKDQDYGTIRLGEEYLTLHYITWFGFLTTWIFLYAVNQTDPGSLNSSPTLSMSSAATASEYDSFTRRSLGRITNWIQVLLRRTCFFVPWNSVNNLCRTVSCVDKYNACNENKKNRREMQSLSLELRRQYDDTLESFARTDGHQSTNPRLLCHSCHIVRPTRSKHCRVLNRCILLFDHHCPFVGTTIGLHNYKYFLAFVYSFTLTDIMFTVSGFLYWKHRSPVNNEIWTILAVIYFSLYTVMTGGLSIYHTQLVRSNLTTNEHQNMRKYAYLRKNNSDGSVTFINPFNKGFIRNLYSRLFPGKDTYSLLEMASNCDDKT
jgi:ankyrin repeat protein